MLETRLAIAQPRCVLLYFSSMSVTINFEAKVKLGCWYNILRTQFILFLEILSAPIIFAPLLPHVVFH